MEEEEKLEAQLEKRQIKWGGGERNKNNEAKQIFHTVIKKMLQ